VPSGNGNPPLLKLVRFLGEIISSKIHLSAQGTGPQKQGPCLHWPRCGSLGRQVDSAYKQAYVVRQQKRKKRKSQSEIGGVSENGTMSIKLPNLAQLHQSKRPKMPVKCYRGCWDNLWTFRILLGLNGLLVGWKTFQAAQICNSRMAQSSGHDALLWPLPNQQMAYAVLAVQGKVRGWLARGRQTKARPSSRRDGWFVRPVN
jgi:hypothetical protein